MWDFFLVRLLNSLLTFMAFWHFTNVVPTDISLIRGDVPPPCQPQWQRSAFSHPLWGSEDLGRPQPNPSQDCLQPQTLKPLLPSRRALYLCLLRLLPLCHHYWPWKFNRSEQRLVHWRNNRCSRLRNHSFLHLLLLSHLPLQNIAQETTDQLCCTSEQVVKVDFDHIWNKNIFVVMGMVSSFLLGAGAPRQG